MSLLENHKKSKRFCRTTNPCKLSLVYTELWKQNMKKLVQPRPLANVRLLNKHYINESILNRDIKQTLKVLLCSWKFYCIEISHLACERPPTFQHLKPNQGALYTWRGRLQHFLQLLSNWNFQKMIVMWFVHLQKSKKFPEFQGCC